MSKVVYVCNRYPKLKIGKHVWFDGGKFETSDEDLQKLIEANDAFNVTIFHQDPPVNRAKLARAEEDAKQQGGYRTEPKQNAAVRQARKVGIDEERIPDFVAARTQLAKTIQDNINARKRGEKVKEAVNG